MRLQYHACLRSQKYTHKIRDSNAVLIFLAEWGTHAGNIHIISNVCLCIYTTLNALLLYWDVHLGLLVRIATIRGCNSAYIDYSGCTITLLGRKLGTSVPEQLPLGAVFLVIGYTASKKSWNINLKTFKTRVRLWQIHSVDLRLRPSECFSVQKFECYNTRKAEFIRSIPQCVTMLYCARVSLLLCSWKHWPRRYAVSLHARMHHLAEETHWTLRFSTPFIIQGGTHIKATKLLLTKYLLNIGCPITIHNIYNPAPPRSYVRRLSACAKDLNVQYGIEIICKFPS
jgi:hypothetical protein